MGAAAAGRKNPATPLDIAAASRYAAAHRVTNK